MSLAQMSNPISLPPGFRHGSAARMPPLRRGGFQPPGNEGENRFNGLSSVGKPFNRLAAAHVTNTRLKPGVLLAWSVRRCRSAAFTPLPRLRAGHHCEIPKVLAVRTVKRPEGRAPGAPKARSAKQIRSRVLMKGQDSLINLTRFSQCLLVAATVKISCEVVKPFRARARSNKNAKRKAKGKT